MLLTSVYLTVNDALPPIALLLFIAIGTQLFYTLIYLRNCQRGSTNIRLRWYERHQHFITGYVIISMLLLIATGYYLLATVATIPIYAYYGILASVLLSIAYGFPFTVMGQHFQLRNIGWLKPFIVALAWVLLVSSCCITTTTSWPLLVHISFMLWLYISLLCIVFDMKDVNSDAAKGIRTFAVRLGICNTWKYIIIPLVVLYTLSGLPLYTMQQAICINATTTIPLYFIYRKVQPTTSLTFYLLVVDGCMLLWACTHIVMWYADAP
jgi:4-hydroxybenzoate polyprenyltransferase